ncbi:hypothetical protein P8C59_000194 [Phyllachora maydis]|uniref:Reverse transcriptase Ty1/copia-type domain-containing protein n=1 Tax=Phyllachora maydis TaxID=1825666 RepID=A0AAD9HWW2_9PEZI|nr:hypothetical protein P8C59_000194 [Phyllachora maydis]
MADQAKGKGIAPKRVSNLADPGQSSRPLLPIRTLLEDKEDGKDYSEVIEVLKYSNAAAATTGKTSYSPRFNPFSSTMDLDSPLRPPRKEPYLRPAVNSATSNLDLPIDTGSKKGFKDTITSSIVKELSKKAYTIPDDKNPDISNTYSNSDQAVLLMLLCESLSSSPRAAISWIHIPSKAFKLLIRQYSRPIESKKEDVYNEFHALTFSTYRKGLLAFNAEFNGYLAKLTIAKIDIDPSLILNYSNSTPNSNSNPSKKGKNKKKGKKKASYNIEGQNHSAKSAKQASFILGSYNLAIEEEEESDSSSNSSSSSDSNTQLPRRRPIDPALYNSWLYDIGSIDHISNSKERFTTFTPNTGQLRPINTGNSPISPAGIGSIILEVLSRKAPPTYTKLVLDNVLYLPNININIVSRVRHYDSGGYLIKETLYRGDRRCIAVLDFKKSGFFLDVEGSFKPILHANFAFPLGLSSYTTKSIEPQRNKIVVEIPSNSIRKEDYRPIIENTIVSEAIEPNKRYKLRNSPAKGTTLKGTGPSLRGKRPYRPTREPKPLTSTRDLPYVLREPVIEGNKVEKAISSPTLKEPNIGQRDYYNLLNLAKLAIGAKGEAIIPLEKRSKSLKFTSRTEECKLLAVLGSKTYLVYIPSRRAVLKTSTVKFIEDNTVLSQPTDNTALEGELVDLDLDLEGAVSPDPSNLNTEKRISIEIGPSKLELYESSSDSKLDKPLPDKPINPVIVESTRPTISIRKPELPETFPQTIEPIFAPKPIEVIAPNQPITNKPLNNSDLISEGDKIQLDYYKLLAKTSSYILSFVYKARKRVISKDSTPTTYKQVLKLPRDKRSKWLEAITKEFIQLLELGVFKFLPRSLLPSNYKLITCRNVLKVKKDAKNRPIKYKSRIPPTWRILLAIGVGRKLSKGLLDLAASNKAIYKLLLKYSYDPSTLNIIKLSKALYSLKQSPREWQDKLKILLKSLGYLPLISDPGVFYNVKTCHFIITYIDNCLFIRPNIGYITDLKNRLNKVYAIEDLGPATYFLGYLKSTKDYSICFSYNGNTVANLGPQLSNSSNTTTKLSRDFHSKEGPRPLTTTSTTIVDSRNSKGSSRTSIINSSLVPIGFSDSDFTGDKATSKSTYGYLYKLAGRPISWKTKRATTIALSTLEAETNGLTEAIREVQWIIGLFSKLYRPIDYPITLYRDNQGSITVANNLALYARTKHTLLNFRYMREQVKAKIVTIIYLNTNLLLGFQAYNLRELFTKLPFTPIYILYTIYIEGLA